MEHYEIPSNILREYYWHLIKTPNSSDSAICAIDGDIIVFNEKDCHDNSLKSYNPFAVVQYPKSSITLYYYHPNRSKLITDLEKIADRIDDIDLGKLTDNERPEMIRALKNVLYACESLV